MADVLTAEELDDAVKTIRKSATAWRADLVLQRIEDSHRALSARLAEAERTITKVGGIANDRQAMIDVLHRKLIQSQIDCLNLRAQLSAERSGHDGTLNRLTSVIADLRAQLAAAEGRQERAKIILSSMNHNDTCDTVRMEDCGYACSCGLTDAFEALASSGSTAGAAREVKP